MEREGETEERAGGRRHHSSFSCRPKSNGSEKNEGNGWKEEEGTDRGKAVVRAQTRMDPLLFHSPQRKEDQEHSGPHGQGWSRGTQR